MTEAVQTVPEFNNKSNHEFTDISSEQWRQYTFLKDGAVVALRIQDPLRLAVSASGGHRVFDASGLCHYVPSGWFHLSWEAKSGQPHFVA